MQILDSFTSGYENNFTNNGQATEQIEEMEILYCYSFLWPTKVRDQRERT